MLYSVMCIIGYNTFYQNTFHSFIDFIISESFFDVNHFLIPYRR